MCDENAVQYSFLITLRDIALLTRKLIPCMFVTACADPENISRGCPRDDFVFQGWRGGLRPISGILLCNLINLNCPRGGRRCPGTPF